jgi:hypothetical protein
VCPVDADVITTVPTLVRYGTEPSATAFVEPDDDSNDAVAQPVPVEAVADFASEAGNPGNRRRLRSVEVRIPHLILRSGLCLVDTPGLGGLESAHGIATLGALSMAHGVLFLSDASQELTAPEMDFLAKSLQRCPVAACVVTKIDLYPEWRRIVELDRAHLADAGIDIPVIAVSSFLRLRARSNPEMVVESGYPALVDFVAGAVVRPALDKLVVAASSDVEFVTDQLGHQLAAEQRVLEQPQTAPQIVQRLDAAATRTGQLAGPTATWQQMLTDGIQDLVAEIEYDLQERLRTVLREAEEIVEGGDPKDSWADIEVWLKRETVGAAVANFDRLAESARSLAERVADTFDMSAAESRIPGAVASAESLAALQLAAADSLNTTGRVASFLLAGRTATIAPMLLIGTVGHLLLPLLAPITAVVLAAGIGQKVIRDERKRQLTFRRQQAKQAVRKYVDEVAFIVGKDSRDALRGTQRYLRDDFQARASTLHRTAESTLLAARRAAELAVEQRSERSEQLRDEVQQVQRVRARSAEQHAVAPSLG